MKITHTRTLIVFLAILTCTTAFTPKFRDVTIRVGIDIRPEGTRNLRKFGGPAIADLDGDGFYDFLFGHHGPESPEIYFSNGNGTFTKSTFRTRRDTHATTPFRLPGTKDRFFTLVQGGNRGLRPLPPVVYRITRDRNVRNVVNETGVNEYTARGRAVVFLPLRKLKQNPDVIYLNSRSDPISCPGCTDGQYDPYAYTSRNPIYRPRRVRDFNATSDNDLGVAIDVDGDLKMELLTWRTLHVHKLVDFFRFKDVSRSVLGEFAYAPGVMGVAEIDFDNDGDFDLYVARDKAGRKRDLEAGEIYADLLLENRGGRYVNVAAEAGIPQDTVSHGVTVGDFNNDRYMDIYVSILRGQPDALLLNNGDGTFRRRDIGIGKQGAYGDNAMAVDYDEDGRVDLVRSEGDFVDREFGGQFRVLKNVPRRRDRIGRYVKVRVGELEGQTSQHAVVVVWANGVRMMQRVGIAGASISHSYFDTLHFGIGDATMAFVRVTWLNGLVRRSRVEAGTVARFGRY